MSNYSNTKATIAANVYTNHNNEVTAEMVKAGINAVVDTLIAGGFLYKGVATTSTNPGSPDANVFYIATAPGTYTNFGSLVVADGEVAILKYNGSWSKEVTGAATAAEVTALGQKVSELDLARQINCGAIQLERGEIAYAGGNLVSTTRVRCADAIGTPFLLSVPAGYWLSVVYFYSAWTSPYNNTVAQRVTVNARTYKCADTYPYIRFSIRKEDGTSFTTNEFLSAIRSELNQIKNGAAALGGLGGLLTGNIRDGGAGNWSNAYKVSSSCIDIRGFLSREITIYTDRPADSNSSYYFGLFFTSSVAAINDEFSGGQYIYPIVAQYENKPAGTMIQIPDNAVGVVAEIFEIPNGGSAGDITLRASDFLGYSLGVQGERYPVEKLLQTNIAFGGENVKLSGSDLRDGSVGNTANEYCIASKYRVDVSDADYVCLFTNRPNSPNCVYRWIYSTFLSASGLSSNSSDRVREFATYASNDYPILIGLNANEKGLAVGVVEYNTSTQSISAVRVANFSGYYLGVLKFGRGVFDSILSRISSAESSIYNAESAIGRYLDKAGALYQACRYHESSATAKDLQLQIITDVHGFEIPFKNAIAIAPSFETIDATICLGDVQDSNYSDSFKSKYPSFVAQSAKPFFMCLGNHDVGNAKYIGFCATHQQEYDTFIKPIVDAGFVSVGEYEAGKSYYYHDFSAPKIRLIVLNEYDEPLDFDTTYWTPVTYDSSNPVVAVNTAYSVGDIVRVNGYTSYSFKCVQAVTTPSTFWASLAEQVKFPSYRIERGTRVIRQTQAQWFLDTLASTPANYGVVVATHNPFSEDSRNQRQYKFAQDVDFAATALMQNSMATDFIANAVNAFVAGSNYSENVAMKGDAAYLNTEGGGTYAYAVSKDFSAKNTGVKFLCYIGGHSHRDLIMKHDTFQQYQVAPICASLYWANNEWNDIKRRTTDGYGVDTLTIISFDMSQKIRLVKIGVDVTTAMTLRDQELIDLTQ